MPDLLDEVARFQVWARTLPLLSRSGEWECDYEHWGDLHAAVLRFLDDRPLESWSREALQAVLYAIARDNEIEHLAGVIADAHRPLLAPLTRVALDIGEPDARWQFAEQLGRVGQKGEVEEQLLVLLVQDEYEYVRRRALGALARIGSVHTERVALREWERPDPSQEWARMMCLWSLHHIGSPLLTRLLADAEQDPRAHLRSYVDRVRRGEVDR